MTPSQKADFGKEFTAAALFRFALPTMTMMAFSGLYTMADAAFAAHFAGKHALAALNIAAPMLHLVVGLGTMFATGANARISQEMGARREREAREDLTLLILVSALAGTALAAAALWQLDPLLSLLGAKGPLTESARDYLGTLLPFFPAYLMQTVFANLFVTAGRPGLGAALSIAAGVLNLILDAVLMGVCGQGVRGAALGTGLSCLLPSAAGLCFFAARRKAPLRLCKTAWRPKAVAECCLNGSSEMVGQLAMAVTVFLFNANMLRLAGADGVAAVTILNDAQFLLETLYIGFSMGVAPILGFQHGRGGARGQKRLLCACLRVVGVLSAAVCGLSLIGGPLLALRIAGGEARVASLAVQGFRALSVSFLFSGMNIFASALFTALSNGKVSALLSFLRTFAFLTAALLTLPRLWGVMGVWLAPPAAEAMVFALSVFFLRGQLRAYGRAA